MIDVVYRCDFCGDVISEQEYINQAILRKSPVKDEESRCLKALEQMREENNA